MPLKSTLQPRRLMPNRRLGHVLAALLWPAITLVLTSGVHGDIAFDNGRGDNLWTTPANWNPDGLPVAPDDAIIDGYDVIIDHAVASRPAALRILDGSLTIRGSGSLTVDSMSIGEDAGIQCPSDARRIDRLAQPRGQRGLHGRELRHGGNHPRCRRQQSARTRQWGVGS